LHLLKFDWVHVQQCGGGSQTQLYKTLPHIRCILGEKLNKSKLKFPELINFKVTNYIIADGHRVKKSVYSTIKLNLSL